MGKAGTLVLGVTLRRGGVKRQRWVSSNTPLPELLLGEQVFCLVVCRHSFIQGKICLAKVGLGGKEEEDDEVDEDMEEEEVDDLLEPDLEEVPALPPGC